MLHASALPVAILALTAATGAQDPVRVSAELSEAIEWFDGLDYPRVVDRPFVRVATGRWSQTGDEPKQNNYLVGFLVRDAGTTFDVFTLDLIGTTFTRSTKDVPDYERVSYDVIPFKEQVAGILSADKGDGDRIFDFPHSQHAQGTQVFLCAWACAQLGLWDTAQALAEEATKSYARTDEKAAERSLRELLAEDLGHVAMWRLIGTFSDRSVSYSEVLKRCEDFILRFADSKHIDRARDTRAILKRMIADDDVHPSVRLEGLDAKARAAELVYRLRDQNGLQWSQPGSCDVFADPRKEESPAHQLVALGLVAVPPLIDALDDESFTRSVGYHRDFHFSHSVLRVRHCAEQVLSRISGQSFWSHGSNVRGAATKWWNEVQTKGQEAVWTAGVRQGDAASPEKAARLLAAYPADALAPIIEGARNARQYHTRMSLVSIAGMIEGDDALRFLREELRDDPLVGCKVSAAIRLFQRGHEDEAVDAMVAEWRRVWQAGDPSADAVDRVGRFLAHCGAAEAARALAAEAEHLNHNLLCELGGGATFFPSVSSPAQTHNLELAKASPEALSVIEDLLVARLVDQTAVTGYDDGTTSPRLCDFAAASLRLRWPDKYAFDRAASRLERARQIFAMRNVRLAELGRPAVPGPAEIRITAIAPERIAGMFKELSLERRPAKRRAILGRIEALGLGALPAVQERIAAMDGVDRGEFERLASRIASRVREVRAGPALPISAAALMARWRELLGEPLDPGAVAKRLAEFIVRPPAGSSGLEVWVERPGDDTGVVIRLVLLPGAAPAAGTGYVQRLTSIVAGSRDLLSSSSNAARSYAGTVEYYDEVSKALARALASPPAMDVEARVKLRFH